MDDNITIYEPDNVVRKGYLHIFTEIIDEIVNNRWLMYQLFKRDFFGIYKQSFIGFLWALILPVFTIVTFIILNQSGIFSIGSINIPYPIFAVLGMAFWQLFSSGLTACANAITNAGSMITKINFSKKSLVLASMGQPFVAFIIQMILAIALFIYYGIAPNIYILLIPFAIIPFILFILGLGFICALLNSISRDISNIISLGLTFILFMTPVLYAKPSMGILMKLTMFNPIYYFISAYRDLIITGHIMELNGFIASSIISIALFILCIIVFHISETRLAERI